MRSRVFPTVAVAGALFATVTPAFASDGEILRRAARADPSDRVCQLALADWIEENEMLAADLARAELIRIDDRLATLPAESPERAALLARRGLLLAEYLPYWAPLVTIDPERIRFVAGRPYGVTAMRVELYENRHALAPLEIQSLRLLVGPNETPTRSAAVWILFDPVYFPLLEHLRHLDVSLHPDPLQNRFLSGQLPHLEVLELRASHWSTERALQLVSRGAGIPTLRRLRIHGRLDPASRRRLLEMFPPGRRLWLELIE